MKFNRNIQALMLLVLISFNIVISNCEQIKNTRSRKIRSSYKRSKITRSHSNSKSKNFILDKIKEAFTDPKNILYFSLGVASEFTPYAEPIYEKVKTIIEAFEPCFDAMKLAYQKIKENKESKELTELRKLDSIKMLEETLAKKEDQKGYCEKTKEEIKENFRKIYIESSGGSTYFGDLEIYFSWSTETNEKVCSEPQRFEQLKTVQELKTKYHSLVEYYKQCMYFSNLDCEIFSPETTSVWNFILNAYNHYGLVLATGQCVRNLVNKPNADKRLENAPGVGSLFDENGFFYQALATTLGLLANIFTLGAWGGIKGGYYLIQLALDIKKFIDDATKDLPFRAGKLVGKGIAIAKSLLFGRRKLYRRMK